MTIVEVCEVYESFCRPVRAVGNDGHQYVLKGPWADEDTDPRRTSQIRRSLIAEQLVAAAGLLLRAPVAAVSIARLDEELCTYGSVAAHLQPGQVHASRLIRFARDLTAPEPDPSATNRERLASLAVLRAWVNAQDLQLLYAPSGTKRGDDRVYCVDHGHSFPGGPRWTVARLQEATEEQHAGALLMPDSAIVTDVGLKPADLGPPTLRLAELTRSAVMKALPRWPAGWGPTPAETDALMDFLGARRAMLLRGHGIFDLYAWET